jgi:hypothetical protein
MLDFQPFGGTLPQEVVQSIAGHYHVDIQRRHDGLMMDSRQAADDRDRGLHSSPHDMQYSECFGKNVHDASLDGAQRGRSAKKLFGGSEQ